MKEVVRGTKINNGISSKVAYILISILAIIGSLQISHSCWSFGEITLFFKGLCEWGCPSNTWQHRGRLERLSEACGSSAHAGVRSLNVLVCHGAVRRCPALLCRWRHSFYFIFFKTTLLWGSLSTVNRVFKVRSWIRSDVWIQRWNLLW